MLKNLPDSDKYALDVLSVITVVGTMANFLPSIAAVLTIVWTGIRIYETDTVQSWLERKDDDEPLG